MSSRIKSVSARFVFTMALLLFAGAVTAEVRLPAIISDHMVLQQETDAVIWGWASPAERVSLTVDWNPGETFSVTADAEGRWSAVLPTPSAGGPFSIEVKAENTLKLSDVMVGEVWVCSGQSNMAFQVKRASDAEREIATGDFPEIRHFQVGSDASLDVRADCTGTWDVCSPETVGNFTAAGYFFGRDLHRKLDVPVGLIKSAWGGTCVEAWTADRYLEQFPSVQEERGRRDEAAAKYDADAVETDYQQKVAKWREKVRTAKAEGKKPPRRPRKRANPKVGNQNYPGNLYRGMIKPLPPFALRGAIWYQGERNSHSVEDGILYRDLLAAMTKNWRDLWQQGDFPFYYVQLPNFKAKQSKPSESTGWVMVRESFLHVTRTVPNTGMAITVDVGEARNIHPPNKQAVGKRLALLALNKTYGRDEVPSGPVYKSMRIKGNRIILSFDYVGSGLEARGGALKTFAIADRDRVFVWADAKIRGDNVVVSSEEVENPLAVRYAWAANPEGCNLYNKEGLPASPFRTDTWEILEAEK